MSLPVEVTTIPFPLDYSCLLTFGRSVLVVKAPNSYPTCEYEFGSYVLLRGGSMSGVVRRNQTAG